MANVANLPQSCHGLDNFFHKFMGMENLIMSERFNDVLARIRADVNAATADLPHLTIPMEDLRLLIQNLETLHSEREELRRKIDQHNDVIEAVAVFIEAYREKYRNYSSGGVRPSAVLRREVRMIWAAMNGHAVATDSSF
ncbi:hypothetical protein LCM4573_15485 [Rhizobium sp. LCM 4573]|nr:hypothetical protein LCM4573_15485 [Rhizobium sp. LCM 4573]